jgi:S-DNA-T family DNA segregation ATPase FtsK/SpoIIIE
MRLLPPKPSSCSAWDFLEKALPGGKITYAPVFDCAIILAGHMFNPLKSLFGKPEPKKGKGKKGKGGKGAPGGKGASPGKGGRGGVHPRPDARAKGGAPPPAPEGPPPAPGLSLDRKLDIAGFALTAVGLISALSLFSANQSPLLAAWLSLLRQAAGWGVYGLPFGFIGIGLWLVLRKFGDKLPKVDPEQIAGVILLYLAFLTTLHFFAARTDAEIYVVARAGLGGGLAGAFILSTLFGAIGQWGSAILLAGWWIIAIVFTAGLSVPEIILLIATLIRRARGIAPPGEERQLPLPEKDHLIVTGTASAASARGARPAPPSSPAPARPAPSPPADKLKPQAPAAPPTAAAFPPPASTPAPAYDQPLIIGGDQPWTLPEMADMLDPGSEGGADDEFDRKRVQIIENTLASFGAPVKVVEINRGPTITQFGVEPDFVEQRGGKKVKVKVGKIAALADDLALALSAQSIRIEAPVPGKGYVGIEVPNVETSLVALRDVMESEAFGKLKGTLRLGLGQDVSGTAICADLAQMPHLLIAGTTGSGKSVCVNSVITCLLLQNTPDDLKMMMVDPKRVELTGYNGIPHLISPVVVDLERVVASLQWVSREMDERYRRFAKAGARNIADYNARAAADGEKKMWYIVVIIDELADLMMLAPDETERTITRLAQLARATGIHLIIATQRPSVDVVTGLIKANFPARIAFAVASSVDSRVILDQPGAERLLGRGDMLFQSPDAATPLRMQGVFVSEHELQRLVRYWKGARGFEPPSAALPPAAASPSTPSASLAPQQRPLWDPAQFGEPEARPDGEDELLEEAIRAVREMKKASISLLQRRLRIGYTRAARLIDALEEKGIVGPAKPGAQQREVVDLGGEVDPTQESAADKRTWSGE